MDTFMADALAEKLDDIERINRLATITESRRNASLHEIDRRLSVMVARRLIRSISSGSIA